MADLAATCSNGYPATFMSGTEQTLCDAADFTPKLSAIIKMDQLLVAERPYSQSNSMNVRD